MLPLNNIPILFSLFQHHMFVNKHETFLLGLFCVIYVAFRGIWLVPFFIVGFLGVLENFQEIVNGQIGFGEKNAGL